jgi:Protein of unknown function (DUF1523)
LDEVMLENLRRYGVYIAVALVLAAIPLAFFDYFLPHHEILQVVGTDVKRVGGDSGQRTGPQFDIRFIYAEDIGSKKPHVFRNEDTGWGFPWYFKFNSSDVQAAARSIANEGGTAAITYYGWRFQIFSLYPNVIRIVRAEPGTTIVPWFNIFFYTVVVTLALWLAYRIYRMRNRRRLAREATRTKRAL